MPARAATVLLTLTVVLLAGGVWATLSKAAGEAPSPVAQAAQPAAVAPRDALSAGARPGRDREPVATSVTETAEEGGAGLLERAAAPGEPPPLEDFGEVVVQRPVLRLDGVATDDPLPTVLGHSAVRFATVMRTATVAAHGADGQLHEVRIAAVDPRGLRVLTPQVTADAQDLWQHLVDGGAIVDHSAVERLGAQLGGDLALADRPVLRLGGFAALGDPSPADVVVSTATGERLGLEWAVSVLVSTGQVARPSQIAEELAQLLGAQATPLVEDRVVELGVTNVTAEQWDDIWDQLAWCESSGRWHLDSGNGYYGGLQFLPTSWWWVGGTGMPHEASREEQIARAKILLAYQGWEAWPVCSRLLGYQE